MKIYTTLKEVLDNCSDWELFCEEKGWSEWAVADGGGDCEVTLTIEEAKRYGLI